MIGWKRKLVLLGVVFFTLAGGAVQVAAKEDQNQTNAGIGYSVQKVDPGGEVSSSSSFYDLLVQPGEERTIQAKLVNPSDEEITIESKLFSASTNKNGEISYTAEAEEPDPTLAYPFSTIAEVAASDIKTTVAPKSEKTISTTIKVPAEVKEGVILGSWYFEKLGQAESNDEDEGIVIKNKYSYAMAVKLTVEREINDPNLNLLNVTTGLNNYRKVINANVQNDRPAIVSNLTITGKVMKKGSYDVLYENTAEKMIMAPNSTFPFPIFLEKGQMKAGDYTLKLTAKTEDPKWDAKRWEWSQDFTITSDEAKKLNSEAINDPQVPTPWWIYVLIGLGIVIIVILVLLLVKRTRDKKREP